MSIISLKDFLTNQTVTAESIQEYYGEHNCPNVQNYVQINSVILSETFNQNVIINWLLFKYFKSFLCFNREILFTKK